MPPSAALPLLSLLLLHLLVPPPAHAARSLTARRVRGTTTPRAADRYDRSVTTFSPDGRLLQLEYALIAAEERGRGATVCVEWEGVVVFAYPSEEKDENVCDSASDDGDGSLGGEGRPSTSTELMSDAHRETAIDDNTEATNEEDPAHSTTTSKTAANTNIDHDPSHNTKLHRLSPTHLLLTSGLAGDARTLASAFRRVASSWTHLTYGEVITAREMAREMGRVRHGIGLRPGARVLGVVGVLIGLDDKDDDGGGDGSVEVAEVEKGLGAEVRMYRTLPGGTTERCRACCTGGGADGAGTQARRDALAALLAAVDATKGGDGEGAASEEERMARREEGLRRIVEEVGGVALMHHPDSNAEEEPLHGADDEGAKRRCAVDIWVVRATSANETTERAEGRAFVSSHRSLGRARMEARCARSVATEQLSTAARLLACRGDGAT